MKLRLLRRLAELEARVEALEEPDTDDDPGTQWTRVPGAPDIGDLDYDRADIWREIEPDHTSSVAVLYDPDELGGYL